ncbi:DASS family sodium-coupled anion symporter [Salinisphaera sp. G21_0]|uniref:SLC13 family permease n=1 Tax=Salinisphaera sp. G21_0 TaxID=2821094 RepID=UPI001ADCB2C2|nr:DASS family sodium-coupled anion symporter [Salinisphaera sp. G21_0]MBO9480991.1 DASS family sodium-coupled anion symporter [Salinisphaera sp. G21_0]
MTTTTSAFARSGPGLTYWVSLIAGPLVLLLTIFTAPPEGMAQNAWYMVGVASMMAIWWVSEVVPIPVTSLLPILLVPLLGVASIKAVTAPFAHPTIYLFFGGFMLGMAMERWNLHKRIALHIMLRTGVRPDLQIGGFMVATAFLSMWVSNTATSVMMLPIGLSVASMVSGSDEDKNKNFSKALLLAIAYSASIGGLATLIGTPPNALLAAFLSETYNIEIGFAQWMMVGLPVCLLMLGASWLWLTKFGFDLDKNENPNATELFKSKLKELGVITRGEKTVAIIFVVTATLWIFRPLLKGYIPGLSDTMIAIAATISLFIIPVKQDERVYVMSWEKAREIPWGVLMLFGGGLTLAAQIKSTGLASWVAEAMSVVAGMPILLVVAFVVTVIIFLTELTSNTATAAGFLPLMGALGVTLGIEPFMLAAPAALAASCAFMMPVATPPNAIVFGAGKLEIKDMIKAGFALNIIGIILVTLVGYYLVGAVLGAH